MNKVILRHDFESCIYKIFGTFQELNYLLFSDADGERRQQFKRLTQLGNASFMQKFVFSENGVAFLYTKFADDHRFETFICVYFETMLTPLCVITRCRGAFCLVRDGFVILRDTM